ncbi:hypothetical protein [Thalassotalea sp. PS06]|uniref:hypothetical protein n=1 Tax=Thalassotalea sp. PS06 TaxID=2594005 RepID=UPI0021B11DB6|nr:hypothetical protein [Thalassotalea sp. PS06]
MEKLFLGISGHVVCLNKNQGEELWKTKIKSSTITNVDNLPILAVIYFVWIPPMARCCGRTH